jgi:hypothetical protein
VIRKLNTRIAPSSLLAMIALFVSLGGVSYAAATIGSAEIKDNSVKSKDVRNKTLVGKDVKPNALGGNQVDESKLGQVPSAATAAQADNAINAQTAAAVGPDGVGTEAIQANAVDSTDLGTTVIRSTEVNVAAGESEFLTQSCQTGEQVISGGPQWLGPNIADDAADLHVVHSYPSGTTGWGARVHNGTASAREVEFRVLCLDN